MSRRTRLSLFVSVILAAGVMAILPTLVRAEEFVGIFLTWTRDPSTTMTVNWVNLYPDSPNTLYYRPVSPKSGATTQPGEWIKATATRSVVTPSSLQRRSIELTGLSPDTTYELSVEKIPEKPEDPTYRFRTMPAKLDRPIRFVTGGDMMHSRDLLDPMNRQAAALDPDFALLGGDLAYENGEKVSRVIDFLQSWTRYATAKDRRLIPMVVAIGNHEVRGGYKGKVPNDAPYFYNLYPLPEGRSYYAMDFGNYLSLIVLDTEHTNPISGAQAAWLNEALSARAQQTYLFPIYHYPAYGTAKSEGNKPPTEHARSVAIRTHWISLFEKYGVSAVFENDHHTFKRTHPIRNHQRDDATGITYIGDGAWGVGVRPVPAPGTAWWLAKAESRNHLWCVDLHPTDATVLRAFDAKGEAFDQYTLPRPRTAPTP